MLLYKIYNIIINIIKYKIFLVFIVSRKHLMDNLCPVFSHMALEHFFDHFSCR